jgi:hypothetical protein
MCLTAHNSDEQPMLHLPGEIVDQGRGHKIKSCVTQERRESRSLLGC